MIALQKFSLSSIISISSNERLALESAFLVASTLPIPIILGSTPTTALEIIFANGFKLYFLRRLHLPKSWQQLRHLNEEFPAVTLSAFFLKAGLSFANLLK